MSWPQMQQQQQIKTITSKPCLVGVVDNLLLLHFLSARAAIHARGPVVAPPVLEHRWVVVLLEDLKIKNARARKRARTTHQWDQESLRFLMPVFSPPPPTLPHTRTSMCVRWVKSWVRMATLPWRQFGPTRPTLGGFMRASRLTKFGIQP